MGKDKEYVVDGATLKCSMGSKFTTLKVTSNNKYKINGKKVATIIDCIPVANLFPPVATFGTCKPYSAVPPPGNLCTPIPTGNWQKGYSSKSVGGITPLLGCSCLFCSRGGGLITIKDTGQ